MMKEKNEAAKALGKLGGQASVKRRFEGMSKEQISEHMKMVRRREVDFKDMRETFLKGLEEANKQDYQF